MTEEFIAVKVLEWVRKNEIWGPGGGLGITQKWFIICTRKEGRAYMY